MQEQSLGAAARKTSTLARGVWVYSAGGRTRERELSPSVARRRGAGDQRDEALGIIVMKGEFCSYFSLFFVKLSVPSAGDYRGPEYGGPFSKWLLEFVDS